MDLERMKTLWDEMSMEVDKQKILTDKLITDMTQERFRNKIKTISYYESIGAVICFISAFWIVANFSKLDTWYLLAMGIFIAAYLLLIPILVLRSIQKMKNIDIPNNNYKETLIEYARKRKHFLFIQRMGIYLNFVLMVAIVPVMIKLIDNKDIFVNGSNIWYWFIPIMVVFLIFFSRWGYSCYKGMTKSAENILNELDN